MPRVRKGIGHRPTEFLGESNTPQPQGAPRGLLQFYALLSLARNPKRGYDLMKEIEIKTEGAWRPGPGAVYPVLQKLVKQGYIKPQKKTVSPHRFYYEITRKGLENIANAKRMMKSSTERWNLMRQLFIDLMEPEDLVRFVVNSMELQIELIHTLVESDKSPIADQDKLFILRQYRLNLERELTRSNTMIKELESKPSVTSSRTQAPEVKYPSRRKASA